MSAILPATPYKGLAPFADTAIDAMLFFGRERDVEIVCANLVASSLTVLYGPSGVGKSSLLAAAVARRLRELPERPVVVVFSTWSESPVAAIAQAVAVEAGVEPLIPSCMSSSEQVRREDRSTSCSTRPRNTSSTTRGAMCSSTSWPQCSGTAG